MEDARELIMPELLIIIPVLYIIGMVIKNTNIFADKYIPLILGIVSIFLCTMYVMGSTHIVGLSIFLKLLFKGITQGVLCAGASVYINQVAVVQPKNKE